MRSKSGYGATHKHQTLVDNSLNLSSEPIDNLGLVVVLSRYTGSIETNVDASAISVCPEAKKNKRKG